MKQAKKQTVRKRSASKRTREGLSASAISRDMLDNLFSQRGRFPAVATINDNYIALAHAIRDRIQRHWISTAETYMKTRCRTVSYLSAEFLPGPHLANNLISLGIYKAAERAALENGVELAQLLDHEEEPGLGNGGLGRLAACFLDSLATLQIPAIGYGIRYEFGIFDQLIKDGWQVELTDKWLQMGNPWEIAQPEISYEVRFGGHTEAYRSTSNRYRVHWIPAHVVKGIPYDTPIMGYGVNTANLLRLWSAQACESFDFSAFNVGDYYGAVQAKITSENITKVLYPNDERLEGKRLRLQQQYFFASCSLRDMIRLYTQTSSDLSKFHRKYAIQLNDTHPAVAIAELMRLLVDEHDMPWDKAWDVTRRSFSFTNHTLMPEAMEKWAVPLFSSLLPRIMEIVYEINSRFLDQVRLSPAGDDERLRRLSIIEETDDKYVRMANLACVGCHAVNGVSELHTRLLKEKILKDFYELNPHAFSNKTNGVTQRRFIVQSNPRLTRLLLSAIGDKWISDFSEIRKLAKFANDNSFLEEWRKVKRENKSELAALILRRTGINTDPDSIFDVQVKRIHEYKRQHLNALHIVTLYNRIKSRSVRSIVPRTFIFGGKAAPGYHSAKLIIKLINSMAAVINSDPAVRGLIKVVFFPDYNVKNAQHICPAVDLSEQISVAGKEASGTGNMKFAMNGALTIGTLDGANVEIREEVGPENFFLFGLTFDEIQEIKLAGYDPATHYKNDFELREAVDLIASGFFSPEQKDLFRPLTDDLLRRDEYMLMADYRPFIECQEKAGAAYLNRKDWTKKSLLNTARMGKFSSDRAIKQYCKEIWKIKPVPIAKTSRRIR